jgi:hypothetical protein
LPVVLADGKADELCLFERSALAGGVKERNAPFRGNVADGA